jgi:hypothetical protein
MDTKELSPSQMKCIKCGTIFNYFENLSDDCFFSEEGVCPSCDDGLSWCKEKCPIVRNQIRKMMEAEREKNHIRRSSIMSSVMTHDVVVENPVNGKKMENEELKPWHIKCEKCNGIYERYSGEMPDMYDKTTCLFCHNGHFSEQQIKYNRVCDDSISGNTLFFSEFCKMIESDEYVLNAREINDIYNKSKEYKNYSSKPILMGYREPHKLELSWANTPVLIHIADKRKYAYTLTGFKPTKEKEKEKEN